MSHRSGGTVYKKYLISTYVEGGKMIDADSL